MLRSNLLQRWHDHRREGAAPSWASAPTTRRAPGSCPWQQPPDGPRRDVSHWGARPAQGHAHGCLGRAALRQGVGRAGRLLCGQRQREGADRPGAHGQQPRVRLPPEAALQVCLHLRSQARCPRGRQPGLQASAGAPASVRADWPALLSAGMLVPAPPGAGRQRVAACRSVFEGSTRNTSSMSVKMLSRAAVKGGDGQCLRAQVPYIRSELPILVIFRALGFVVRAWLGRVAAWRTRAAHGRAALAVQAAASRSAHAWCADGTRLESMLQAQAAALPHAAACCRRQRRPADAG